MMIRACIYMAVFALVGVSHAALAQQRPSSADRYPPEPPANHVEVRFASGKETITCKRFKLTAKEGGRIILSGVFTSSFPIPSNALSSPSNFDITPQCGEHKWHFSELVPQAFRHGWWWVGTDYPPFQEMLENGKSLQDALWVKYLIVDPIGIAPCGSAPTRHPPKSGISTPRASTWLPNRHTDANCFRSSSSEVDTETRVLVGNRGTALLTEVPNDARNITFPKI